MRTLLLTTAAGAAVLVGTAAAQDTRLDAAQPVDQIVVTATKREQTLQEVPVAVSVVQEETIENAQIIDVFDLQSVVPSLRVNQNQSSGNVTFTIRGFGNGANNLGIEPSVGIFIDGVYRSRSASAISDLAEIERVEVLRGPQSTLFGKNASAGVVSVVTQSPQFDFQGKGEVTYGNYDQRLVKGYVTGPITDSLAVSLEGSINKRDGYADNVFTGDELNDRDRWALRGQALFQPTDGVSFRLIADYDELEEVCCYAANVVAGPTVPLIRALGGEVLTDSFDDYRTALTFDPSNDILNRGVSGQLDWDLGFAELTSITAYRERRSTENYDGEFTTLDNLDQLAQINSLDTFTQEVRLSGATDRLGWLAGVFYTDETVSSDSFISYGQDQRAYGNALAGGGLIDTEQALIGLGILPPGTVFQGPSDFGIEDFDQDNQSLSIFGQLDFDVTDRLTLTVGANYTTDEKDVSLNSTNAFTFSNLNLVEIGNAVIGQQALAQGFAGATGLDPTPANIGAFAAANPAAFAQIQAGAQAFADANDTNDAVNPFLALVPLQFLPPNVSFPNAVEDGQSDDEDVTYTARLAYDVTDRINVYGSYATGFKASSWNLTRDSRPFPGDFLALQQAGLLPNITVTDLAPTPAPDNDLAVDTDGDGVPDLPVYSGTRFAGPEESRVFEIGLKSQFDWGSFNFTLFDQKIEGFQSNLFQGTGFVLANAGEQNVQGFETEVLASPVEWFDLNFAATYLDATYEEFVGAQGPNGPTDLSGERVAGVPKWATSTTGTFSLPLPNLDAFARIEHQYESSVKTADNLPDSVPEREVNVINASLGANFENGFEALLWARNLNNDTYLTVGFPSTAQAGSYTGYANPPRTYGVTVRKRF